MPSALLLPGTGSTPTDYWFPSITRLLESGGYQVTATALPQPDRPELAESLVAVRDAFSFDTSTLLIAHSSACPLALSLLEGLDEPLEQAILVAGFYQPIAANPDAPLMLQERYDWPRIRRSAREITFINSDNDPWGCTDAQARAAATHLTATLIVPIGEAHMGSQSLGQPYKQFPLLERVISRRHFA